MLSSFEKNSKGRYWPQDEKGYLINDTSWGKVTGQNQEIVAKVSDLISEYFPSDIVSFYLRGSAAWGGDIPGLSDLDFIVITSLPNYRWELPNILISPLSEITKHHNLEIDLAFASVPNDFNTDRPFLATQIKCFSLLLSGIDFAAQIDPVGISSKLIINRRWFGDDLAFFCAKKEMDDPSIRNICKVSLRTAFELVMEREARFTNSLPFCVAAFCKYYPEWTQTTADLLCAYEYPNTFDNELKKRALEFWDWLKKQ